MDINQAFGIALREIRQKRKISQEDLSEAVSRVYVSSLERGLKSPTLETIDKVSEVLDIHPLKLLALAYKYKENDDAEIIKSNS